MKLVIKESPGVAERYKGISGGEQQILLFKTPGTKPELCFSKGKQRKKNKSNYKEGVWQTKHEPFPSFKYLRSTKKKEN